MTARPTAAAAAAGPAAPDTGIDAQVADVLLGTHVEGGHWSRAAAHAFLWGLPAAAALAAALGLAGVVRPAWVAAALVAAAAAAWVLCAPSAWKGSTALGARLRAWPELVRAKHWKAVGAAVGAAVVVAAAATFVARRSTAPPPPPPPPQANRP